MSSMEHGNGPQFNEGSSSSMDQLRKERRKELLTEQENLLRELNAYLHLRAKFVKLDAIEEELKGFDS